MENPFKKIINEIAQELNCGNDCYFNLKTEEIIAIPNFSQISDEDEFQDIFREQLEKVKKQKADFIKFEVLESFESFKIMERFIEQINDQHFKAKLKNTLQEKKPFQNFKHLIDHSDFRQSWFDFEQNELERIVESQMNR
jgi:predicted aldo/keto reductase-like oxidoreductase